MQYELLNPKSSPGPDTWTTVKGSDTLVRFGGGYMGRHISMLFFCGECGIVYGRIRAGKHWQAKYGCCLSCTPSADLTVPGSVYVNNEELIAGYPPQVLYWELEAHINWYQRQLEKYGYDDRR
jgi:hypothetical protein